MLRTTLTLVLLFLLASPAGAEIYKWVDANGKAQYSDKPPSDGTKKVETPVFPALPPQSSSQQQALDREQKQLKMQEYLDQNGWGQKPKPQPSPAKESNECTRAQDMVKAIKEKKVFRSRGGPMAAEKDRVYLDENELKLYEADVEKYCK